MSPRGVDVATGDGVTLNQTKNGIGQSLDQMVRQASNIRGYLNTVIYRQYMEAQKTRWITENTSEGSKWDALNPAYATRKKRVYGGGPKYKMVSTIGTKGFSGKEVVGQYKAYPGSGEKMLVATSRLYGSVLGPKANMSNVLGAGDHRKVVTDNSIIISTVVPYAADVAKIRPFMGFGKLTISKMKQGLKDFLFLRKKGF